MSTTEEAENLKLKLRELESEKANTAGDRSLSDQVIRERDELLRKIESQKKRIKKLDALKLTKEWAEDHRRAVVRISAVMC